MSTYTPQTQDILVAYRMRELWDGKKDPATVDAEFYRWLDAVKAEARSEGFKQGDVSFSRKEPWCLRSAADLREGSDE